MASYSWTHKVPRKGNPHKMAMLPCLAEKIRQAGATNDTLSRVVGCSEPTVQRARNGKPVHLNLGIAMYDALNKYKFQRSPCGAK